MELSKAKMAHAINIVVDEAIQTLAKVHKTTEAVIQQAIQDGNLRIEKQMTELIAKGLQELGKLHQAGAINLKA